MYNYKFDDDVTNSIIASCCQQDNNELACVINKINKVNKHLFYDYDLINDLKSCQKNNCLNLSKNLKKITISNDSVFNSDELENFKKLDAKFNKELNAIAFVSKMLNMYKSKAKSSFNLNEMIKLNKKLFELKDGISSIENEINNYNKEIELKEKGYLERFEKFLNDLKTSKKIDENYFINEYGKSLIANYKRMQIVHILDNFLDKKNCEAIIKILSNDNLKNALNENYQIIIDRYLHDVGANC